MSFLADLTRGQRELRAYAEARMTSRAVLRRRRLNGDGSQLWDVDEDGYETPAWDELATVPIRIGGEGASKFRKEAVGGTDVEVSTETVSLPLGTSLRDDDYLEVVDGPAGGRVLVVVDGGLPADQKTARRVQVIEVSRPGEW